jgi:N-acetylneuraminic acid mutarotase
VERYDEVTNTWSPISHMLKRRSGACSSVYDGKIYVAGGHDGPNVHKSVEVYDPMYNKWKFIAELNTARRNAGFIEYNGLFYVIGGDDGQKNLSSVEIYNPQRDVWSLLPTFLNEAKSYTNCLLIDSF